ncbi:hypothetical protein [Parvibaculum sp.]|nr:hypothetical protein [Parvibaculum sp.]|tara:strand:- start:13797 stop:13925 length:129 start_codon:yes stop_codon:yes gene_type:complete
MSKFVSALAGWKGYAALALFVAGILAALLILFWLVNLIGGGK